MLRAAALMLLLSLLTAQSSGVAAISNDQFCEKGVEKLADSLASALSLPADSAALLLPIEGRFGPVLMDGLVAGLKRQGVSVYLANSENTVNRPVVKTTADDYHLSYEGVHRGLFSRGSVARVFSISAYSQVMGQDGKMWRSARISSLMFSDTLSYADARTARGKDSFMSPAMPPTVYKRLVEPGLILGITGALVYLFFASR